MDIIDLNCDLGEGSGCDEQLMPLITSANIACGGHAGDEQSMLASIRLAKANAVNIGAHPGFPDRANFGRREMHLSPSDIREVVRKQISALTEVAKAEGVALRHAKPHGALYNLAARNRSAADAIASAICDVDRNLILVAPPGSEMIAAGESQKLATAAEFFADRTYQPDGSLTPRTRIDALIDKPEAAVEQVLRMIRQRRVVTTTGQSIDIAARTVCVHGDGASAVAMLRSLRSGLEAAGVAVVAF
jgi:UPF0271 protein